MPDTINPRPLFARAMTMLAAALCPHCKRQADATNPIMNRPDYHCPWCAARDQAIDEYREWRRQDEASRRAAKKAQADT